MKHILFFDNFKDLEKGRLQESANPTQENKNLIDSFYSAIKSSMAEEEPRGSNKGTEVELLLKGVGVAPGNPWCVGFIRGVLSETKFKPEELNKIPKSASVKLHWEGSKGKKVIYTPGMDADKILPGMMFFYLTRDKNGGYPGKGHTGIILSVDKTNGTWTGIEGNTNPFDGGREGYGTFILSRKISDPSISTDPKEHPAKLLGFIDYFSPYRAQGEFTNALNKKMKELQNELYSLTNDEIQYLKKNPKELDRYSQNYKNRFSKISAKTLSPLGTPKGQLKLDTELSLGNEGQEVAKLQQILNRISEIYKTEKISEDGNFGISTKKNLSKFFGKSIISVRQAYYLLFAVWNATQNKEQEKWFEKYYKFYLTQPERVKIATSNYFKSNPII